MNLFKRKTPKTAKPTAESIERRNAYPRRPVVQGKRPKGSKNGGSGRFRGTTARYILTHHNPNRHTRRYAAAITRSVRKLARSKNAGK